MSDRLPDQGPSTPVPLTAFVGRVDELARVTALLARPDVRLLTLTGPGGIGKTRLALRAAERVSAQFADGVVFVSLASVRDSALVLPTVAHVLNVPDVPEQPLLTRVQAFLATREMLLVLDNLEHLLDAAASLVAALLSGCSRLVVLATSRSPLELSGEHRFALAALHPEAARQLFVTRAEAAVPTFALTAGTTPVIDAICARLDGLPLAIELAAARIPVLPPRALLVRLDHRLDLLTGGPCDAPRRLREMRGAIAWSHDLLDAPAQILFRRLGVFVGGFTLDAAAAVAGQDSDVLEGVSALVAASLVVPTAGVGDEPRFTMLETIREYALEQLVASGEVPSIKHAHAQHVRCLAESVIPVYDGPDSQTFNDRMEIELDNCRAAMTWTLEAGDPETGIRLAGALWRVWWYGHAAGTRPWSERVDEGRAWLERLLVHREGLGVGALIEALTGAGILARLQGDLQPGEVYGRELLDRSRAECDAYGSFWAHYMLGCTAEARGDTEEAKRLYEQAVQTAPGIRNPGNHGAIPRVQLGRIAERAGDLRGATTWLEEALALHRDAGNPHGVATASLHLGRVICEQDDLAYAVALLEESLGRFMEERDLGGVHASLAELARLALKSGQLERCTRLLAAAAAFPGHPNDHVSYQQTIDSVRGKLGGTAFAAAWDDGMHLTWDEVRSEVNALTAPIDAAAPNPEVMHGLTRREREVLQLLVEGGSNRTIAETLSLSERTVEHHVLHILTKLGLDSRTAAATWAVRHGLD